MARPSRTRQRNVRLGLQALSLDLARLPNVPGQTLRDVLQAESCAPLRGPARDLQHDGLFGDGMLQQELFRRT